MQVDSTNQHYPATTHALMPPPLQAGLWEQCGGINSNGRDAADLSVCCKDGAVCARVNEYYWQCKPPGSSNGHTNNNGGGCRQVSWQLGSWAAAGTCMHET